MAKLILKKVRGRSLLENRSKSKTKREQNNTSVVHHAAICLTPHVVDDLIKTIQKGRLMTFDFIHKTCEEEFGKRSISLNSTKIFARLSAWAAEAVKASGKKRITPYWRILKKGGRLDPKFPGDVERQAKYLASEGFKIIPDLSDNLWKVADYEKYLIQIV